MSPEEKGIKMWLLDLPQEKQEFYRTSMESLLKDFQDKFDSYEDDVDKGIFVAALSIAIIKFGENNED